MKIARLLAALSLGTALATGSVSAASAAPTDLQNFTLHQQGAPLMKGVTQSELVGLINASLVKDPTGKLLLSPKLCRENGSCATAYDYYIGISTWHPKSGVTLAGLGVYIAGLQARPSRQPDEKFFSSRLVQRELTSGYNRAALPGEKVLYDLQTGEEILFADCGNVIKPMAPPPQQVAVTPDCITVATPLDRVPSDVQKTEIIIQILGPAEMPYTQACHPRGAPLVSCDEECHAPFERLDADIVKRYGPQAVAWHDWRIIKVDGPPPASFWQTDLPQEFRNGGTISACLRYLDRAGVWHTTPVSSNQHFSPEVTLNHTAMLDFPAF